MNPRTPLDWRSAAWLAPSRALSEEQRARHEAALAVLDEYNAVGTPFALFLRTFAIRQLYCHASDGGDGGDGILLEVHLTRRLRQVGANLIQVQDLSRPFVDASFPNETPGLLLDESSWLVGVGALIDSAELIVSECQFLSPGVVAELRACGEAGKIDQTVLVLPSPPFEFIGNEEALKVFPRTIQQHDLDLACPARSAVFQDLVDRLAQIAGMKAAKRIKLIREGKLRQAVPVSYKGVAESLLRLAQQYAQQKNVGATYFVGSRAVLAATAAGGPGPATELLLSLADLCEEAGDAKLALVLIDEVETNLGRSDAAMKAEASERLLGAARRRRAELLGRLFESLMSIEHASELWQLAKSQAGYALQRQDHRVLAQCLSWMSVAALLNRNYELALDHAQDAIAFAQQSGDAYREAFSYFYLGNAHRDLNQTHEAAEAFARAIELFPQGHYGRIHAAAMLGMAEMSEQLEQFAHALQLYRSARDLANGLGQADLGAAADRGIARVSERSLGGP